jgi:DNA mismatch endonuclease (patch repair protein)
VWRRMPRKRCKRLADVHDRETRSRNMAAIKSRNTKPEVLLRSALHRAGFRFRLNGPLPGKPDLTLRKYGAAIFVHGCFWHKHDCPRFKQPGGDNAVFWRAKLARNAERDCEVAGKLLAASWRQFVVWECALVGKGRLDLPDVVNRIGVWLRSDAESGEIAGAFD